MASADASVIICTTCRSTITGSSIADDTTSGSTKEPEKSFDSHDVQIDGFEITGVLGRGGMGVVLSGVQASLGRNVADIVRSMRAGFGDFIFFFRGRASTA